MTINVHNRILLTGAAGGLGTALRERLKANCNVLRLSDRLDFGPAGEREEVAVADLADADAVMSMMQGVDAIVHLGGVSVESPFNPILQANIIGAYNLYEAARKQGVKRVVFASSNHVTGFYKQSETITADQPARPDGLYGLSKAFGEDLSRLYFDRYGIETACVRIGSSFPEPRDRRMLATWLSFDDLHRLITACLTTSCSGAHHHFRHVKQCCDLVGQLAGTPCGLCASGQFGRVSRGGVCQNTTPRPQRSGCAVPGWCVRAHRPLLSNCSGNHLYQNV